MFTVAELSMDDLPEMSKHSIRYEHKYRTSSDAGNRKTHIQCNTSIIQTSIGGITLLSQYTTRMSVATVERP